MTFLQWPWSHRGQANDTAAWSVHQEGQRVIVSCGKQDWAFLKRSGQRLRIVPLGGSHVHGRGFGSSGWQLAVDEAGEDILLGPPVRDWQTAQRVAQQLCQVAGLSLDDLTAGLFRLTTPGDDKGTPHP